MTASKELMEMRELYNKGVIADLVPLYREVDRSRELLRHTSASITFIRYHPDGNGGYDEGTIEECSDVKAAHYGLTRDDVIGSSNFVLMKNRKEAAKAREDDIWVMENKKPLIDIIEEITRPDGTKVIVSVTKSPWYYFKDKSIVCGVICIARDITLRVQAEQKLQGVLNSVVNDVFNPLMDIQSFIMKLDGEEQEKVKGTFGQIIKNLEELKQQLA